jgi:hypothetical protein
MKKQLHSRNNPVIIIAIDRKMEKRRCNQHYMAYAQRLVEHLPNVPNYIAIHARANLAWRQTGTEDLKGLAADDSRWGHIASGEKLPVDKAPIIIEDDLNKLTTELMPVKDKPLNFTIPAVKLINPIDVTLQPFYQIHDARYMMYWMALSNTQYKSYLDSLSVVEKAKLELEKTYDRFCDAGRTATRSGSWHAKR